MESFPDKTWHDYLAKIKTKPHREILEKVIALLPGDILCAVDCGCGVGNNSQFLIDNGINVHAFDKDPNAVNLCRMRFLDDVNFAICLSDLSTYIYPANSLVLASSSFFLCDPKHFEICWYNLSRSIQVDGLFCGDFLGINDSYVKQDPDNILALSEADIRRHFSSFEIIDWHETNRMGISSSGEDVNRHSHTLLARKSQQ